MVGGGRWCGGYGQGGEVEGEVQGDWNKDIGGISERSSSEVFLQFFLRAF